MSVRLHGLTSIGLTAGAILLAAVAAFQTWWVLGFVYLAASGLALAGILYAYCAKCPCQTNCGHVLPGWVAGAFMKRQQGPYTTVELAVVVVALLLLLGMPQVWLWRYPGLFIAFWVLSAIAVILIRGFVCRACDNVYCPASLAGRGSANP